MMRPIGYSARSSTSEGVNSNNGGSLSHWKTPVPYLFGGIVLMLGLISMALIILACSCKRSYTSGNYSSSSSSSSSSSASPNPPSSVASATGIGGSTAAAADREEEKSSKKKALKTEPKIVVIMAGDENPTFLANPTIPACSCSAKCNFNHNIEV